MMTLTTGQGWRWLHALSGHPAWRWCALGGLALIFAADGQTQLGFAHGSLYPPVILLALFTGSTGFVLAIALAAAGLTVAGIFISPAAPAEFAPVFVLANRVLALAGIGLSCLLSVAIIHYLQQVQSAYRAQLRSRRESERLAGRLSSILECMTEAFFILDEKQRVVFANRKAELLLGTASRPMLGQPLVAVFPQLQLLLASDRTEGEAELFYPRCERWLACHYVRTGEGLALSLQDSTERKRNEQIQLTEARALQMIYEGANRHEVLTRIVLGIEQVLPNTLASVLLLDEDGIHLREGAAPSLPESYNQAVYGQPIGPEAGSCGTAMYRRQPVIVEDIATDPLWTAYQEPALAHGLRACWSIPVLDGEGRVLASFALYHHSPKAPTEADLTLIGRTGHIVGLALERYRQEATLRSLEEQLRHAQRMEAVGQLTGGIAHDFNNLLTVILGNGELLQEQLAREPALAELARMMVTAAQRGADLTHRLLAFARRQALEPRVIQVNELVEGMGPLLTRALGQHISMELRPSAGLGPALVDPGQLESALLNLCLNARDAMPEGGRLTLETADIRLDRDYAASHAEVAPGHYVLLAVSDTGSGIPPEHLGRIFEPFFTTKEKGKGSGLGLSMVFGFIRQTNGHISVYSELGIGTVVKMYLPRAETGAREAEPADNMVPVQHGGGECILLVEDDELVRRYAEEQLLGHGFRVLSTGNGHDALALLRQRDDIDLLFTDVVMPGGLGGAELAARARALRPELKVLFTSGYTENAIVHQGRLEQGVLLLGKPYRRAELMAKVRQAIDHS
ncbi:ATP-binding protein [Zobellella iuensis]|uniref:histidine kinase n=1 Tax=Zobellella iuensis TaxID=2803811 RepID=A0ABS1QSD0_9GAMM|nr:ATP-binding protein [Zobellella iuensis]MBL1377371.1 GAF domain-containing protein [Zobellella iuensis]